MADDGLNGYILTGRSLPVADKCIDSVTKLSRASGRQYQMFWKQVRQRCEGLIVKRMREYSTVLNVDDLQLGAIFQSDLTGVSGPWVGADREDKEQRQKDDSLSV
ncbi:MAG: hypothetical protein OEN50_12965 [Deltaproteobacteria bacterium]|nr:hypothetical protein [Deltaproteobacteria bacterium]